jgi:uncharacterized protein (TIGR02246 family)
MPKSDAGEELTVEDRFAIADLLAVYNWALDTDDADAFVSTFTADGEFVTPAKVLCGEADLRGFVAALHNKRDHAAQRSQFHNVSNVVIRGNHSEVRFVAQMIGPRTDAEGRTVLQLGWYDDIIRNTPDGWRFAHRHFRPWPDQKPGKSPAGTL